MINNKNNNKYNKNDIVNWVNDYTDYLFKWALYRTNNTHISEDIVQEAFYIAVKQIDSFEGKSSPKTWLTAILNNLILDYYRQKIKSNNKIDIDISDYFTVGGHWSGDNMPKDYNSSEINTSYEDENLLDNEEFNLALNNCINNLPVKFQSVIKYKYVSDKNADEICKELGISKTNYWQLIHRGKLALRKCIEINFFDK